MNDCITKNTLPFEQALSILLETIRPLSSSEDIAIESVTHRVLASDIIAPFALPRTTHAAMDGYAIRFEDWQPEQIFNLVGQSLAGHPYENTLGAHECIRIMTGAPLPQGADTVIMQENSTHNEQGYCFHVTPKQHQHIRFVGEDIAQDQCLFCRGHRIRASDISLLASLGLQKVPVISQPKAIVFSSGDELIEPGRTLGPSQLYDSNSYTAYALLKNMHIDVTHGGILPDNFEASQAVLEQASKEVDIILTSGGVSVGDADFIKPITEKLGDIYFWKVAMKPGKPIMFGKINQAFILGLPGNPVSQFVTLHQFGIPAIQQLQGKTHTSPIQLKATCLSNLRKRPGRKDFQRGLFQYTESGHIQVTTTGAQGSGMLSSVLSANCFIILDAEQDDVKAGETVLIEPFHHFFN